MIIKNNQIRKEQLEQIEELVIVIDVIKGFIYKGALAAPSIARIIPPIKELIEETEQKPNAINVFGDDWHPADALEFRAYGEHGLINSEEADIVPELEEHLTKGLEFKKNSVNLFVVPGFKEFLDSLPNLKRVIFVGCLSEVCVKRGALTTREYFNQIGRDIDVLVWADAIDTYDAPGHNVNDVTQAALAEMTQNCVKKLARVKKTQREVK